MVSLSECFLCFGTTGGFEVSTQAIITGVSDRGTTLGADLSGNSFTGLWDPAKNIARWTWGRDAFYLIQLWKTAIPIWLADMTAVALSVALSAIVFQVSVGLPSTLNLPHIVGWCVTLSVACLLSGLYPGIGLNNATELRLLARVVGAGVTLWIAYDVIHGGDNKYLLMWPLCGVLMIALMPLLRAAIRRMVCKQDWWGLKTIVIGAGDRGMQIMQKMRRNPSLGFKPVAMVDRYRQDWMASKDQLPAGGISSLEDTPRLSERHHAYCGMFIGSDFPVTDRLNMIDTLTSVFPQLYITTDSADAGRQWSGNLDMGATRLLRVTEHLLMPGARWIKRAIDVTAILLVAPFIAPLVACLALIVKFTSKGPAFYCHPRIGRNGRTIRVWKLRSMVPNADVLLKKYLADNPHLQSDWDRLHKLPNDPRVTAIGRILRKTSLDEIPQLWNVLCGEMSLVGPRPIVQAEVSRYQSVYPLYLRVTPGITGLWQVNGRNSTTYEERISYDAEYVRNWSVYLDLYILARTVQTVVTCDGAC